MAVNIGAVRILFSSDGKVTLKAARFERDYEDLDDLLEDLKIHQENMIEDFNCKDDD